MPLSSIARQHGTKQVTIIHLEGTSDEVRTEVEAMIQSKSNLFDLTTPIYDGDTHHYSKELARRSGPETPKAAPKGGLADLQKTLA